MDSLASSGDVDCKVNNVSKSSLTNIEQSEARTYIAVRYRDILNEYFKIESSLYTQALSEYIRFNGSIVELKEYFYCQSVRYKVAPEVARKVVSDMTK